MAIRYLRSTTGNNSNSGATWALAKATMAGIDAIDTAGDTIWLSQAHSETTAALVGFNLAGTAASPQQVLCGNDAAEPPTALATTAVIATTGATSNITIPSSATAYATFYGISFLAGDSTNSASINMQGRCLFEQCSFQLRGSGVSQQVSMMSSAGGFNRYKDCTLKFAAVSHGLTAAAQGNVKWTGGSLLAGGVSPGSLVSNVAQGANVVIDGLDLTNASSSMNLCNAVAAGATVIFRNCRLPAAWSGALNSSVPGAGALFEMFNCDSADTHYHYRRAVQNGTIQDETTVVRTGGASNGTTTYSFKMVSNSTAKYPYVTLDTPEIVKWNATVGSPMTATVEFVHDSLTALKDNEVWLDVMYLGTSGVPLASFANDAVANVVTAAANQDASGATWTTTGLVNPNTQKLVATFTPQEEGFIHCVVRLAKASYTIYVDPLVTVA